MEPGVDKGSKEMCPQSSAGLSPSLKPETVSVLGIEPKHWSNIDLLLARVRGHSLVQGNQDQQALALLL